MMKEPPRCPGTGLEPSACAKRVPELQPLLWDLLAGLGPGTPPGLLTPSSFWDPRQGGLFDSLKVHSQAP